MFNDNKCNNFQTKFAYINGLSINIIDYINNYSRKSHCFKHKYDNYNKFNTMTEWYSE